VEPELDLVQSHSSEFLILKATPLLREAEELGRGSPTAEPLHIGLWE